MMRQGTLTLLRTFLFSILLVVGVWVAPSAASDCNQACIPCHGNPEDVHGSISHSATLGSGVVAIFPDNGHDDTAWVGDKPYFGIAVNCSICHNYDLPQVHGNDCATCHPTPYDTLGTWNRGCQQGGCHSTFHEKATTTAHAPFESSNDPGNDCSRCHTGDLGPVTQYQCLNCHAAYSPGDTTPPLTTSNAQATYYGAARIVFSIIDNGKVGVGRTFYRLDGGPVTAGSELVVTAPGAHELEFWSKDQYGNTELAPNTVLFSIVEDTTPPVTTSNAQTAYTQGATITLTATDNSPGGVKATYYRLDTGPVQTGTSVVIPATPGSITYTLVFWSEDWAGNVEAEKSVSFTVNSGGGTFRLIWGNSDVAGSPCAPYGDEYFLMSHWTVYRGAQKMAEGWGYCPDWDGVDDVAVPVSTTPHTVTIDWYDADVDGMEQSSYNNQYLTTPGQVITIRY